MWICPFELNMVCVVLLANQCGSCIPNPQHQYGGDCDIGLSQKPEAQCGNRSVRSEKKKQALFDLAGLSFNK